MTDRYGRFRRRGLSRVLGILLVIWFIIGAIAAAQRGYFSSGKANCAKATTVFVTVLAGPLNYVGANPKADCPTLPEPSK